MKWEMVDNARELCGSVRGGEKNPATLLLRERRLLESRCWELEIKLQKRDVWNLKKKKDKV